MHQDFVVVDVVTDLFHKKLDVYFNFDVDAATVTSRSLQLVESKGGAVVPVTYAVDGQRVSLTLRDDPVPDAEYILLVNKEIRTVTRQPLLTEYMRHIFFRSAIKNTVQILSPSDMESVSDIHIIWQEQKYLEAPFLDSYRIQIARDNTFQDIVIDTTAVQKTEMQFMAQPPNQYFLRIRVESDTEFGPWSKTISFVLQEKDTPKSLDDVSPVIRTPLTVLTQPENGSTPASFILTFDSPIDADALTADMITVTREDW